MSCPRTNTVTRPGLEPEPFNQKASLLSLWPHCLGPQKKTKNKNKKTKQNKAKQKKLLGISLINQLFLTYCIQVVSSQRFECTPVKCQQFSYTACLQEFHTRIYISSWLLHI